MNAIGLTEFRKEQPRTTTQEQPRHWLNNLFPIHSLCKSQLSNSPTYFLAISLSDFAYCDRCYRPVICLSAT